MITVLGYDGQKIGEVSNYADAKAMQLHDIKEHRPELADRYAGISTQQGSEGMPVFH